MNTSRFLPVLYQSTNLFKLRKDEKISFLWIVCFIYFVGMPQYLIVVPSLIELSLFSRKVNSQLGCFPHLRTNHRLRFSIYIYKAVFYQLILSICMVPNNPSDWNFLNFPQTIHIGFFSTALLLMIIWDSRYHVKTTVIDYILYTILTILALYGLLTFEWYIFLIIILIEILWLLFYIRKGDYL